MVDKQTAEQEFNRWLEASRLKFEENEMDIDDRKDFTLQRERILDTIMSGSLVVDEDGKFIFSILDNDPIIFHRPTGAILLSMERKKKDATFSKMFVALASMTRTTPGLFSSMNMPDLQVCLAIVTLFLA